MGQQLWIGNLPPEATDDEVVELVKKYSGCQSRIAQHVPGTGTRPAVVVEFAADAMSDKVEMLALRLAGMHWRGHTLTAARVPGVV